MNTIVVNLYGGPSTGKSTTAAGVFSVLKSMGVECEYVTEYAKDKVWEESFGTLNNQIYVFGKQHHRIFRCLGKVDVIVTDSPILLSLIYGEDASQQFKDLVIHEFCNMTTLDVFLERCHEYNTNGRMQTADEALIIDSKIKAVLERVDYHTVAATTGSAEHVVRLLKEHFPNVFTGQ